MLVYLVLSCIFLSLFVVVILKIVSFLISEQTLFSREELSAFECGFDPYSLSRVPFSLRYFFLTLVFLLFDLEIVLLVFSPFFVLSSYFFYRFLVITFFAFVLLFSLFYELSDGTLDWVL